MTFKKAFLPAGLVVAIAAALAVDLGERATGGLMPLRPWLVITIFLINGYQTRLRDAPRSLRFAAAFLTAAVLTLLAAPWLGRSMAGVLGMSGAMALGLIVMSSVPSTLSSGIVLTEVTGGNSLWALILTIGLNGLGVLTIPFVLKLCLRTAAEVEVDPLPLLGKLVLLVLVPFVAGGLVRGVARGRQLLPLMKYIPSTCVILTVWISCAAKRDSLLTLTGPSLGLIAAGALTVHLVLMVANLAASFPLRLKPDERRATMFLGSQKTLPVALGVLTALGSTAGQAVIVCITFHFLQLVTDSFIAAKMAAARARP